jgi:diguanylate cyclase
MVRLQRELTKHFFLHDNEKMLITFSCGVALRLPNEDQASLMARVDRAMYQAKQSGKNRVWWPTDNHDHGKINFFSP